MPERVVNVEQACGFFLDSMSSSSSSSSSSSLHGRHSQKTILSEEQIASVLKLFQFAHQTRRHHYVTHLLVDVTTNDNHHHHNNGDSTSSVITPQCYLLPADGVYLGRWVNGHEGADLEDLASCSGPSPSRGAKSRLPFVSLRYANVVSSSSASSSASSSTTTTTNQMLTEFFTKCGARKTIALIASTRNITTEELTSTSSFGGKMPTLRSSSTSVSLCYPYGLGEMNRKKPLVVDVALSQEWMEIMTALGSLSISSSSSSSSSSFSASSSSFPSSASETKPHDGHKSAIDLGRVLSTLISRLLSPPTLDAASPQATPESTPCAASALKGQRSIEQQEADDAAALRHHQHGRHYLPEHTPYPAHARMYYLPPGQAGANATSVGPAKWIMQLAELRFIPAVPAGTPSTSTVPSATVREREIPPSLLLRPCEAILPQPLASMTTTTLSMGTKTNTAISHVWGSGGGSTGGGATSSGGGGGVPTDMPVARLPPVVVRAFLASPPVGLLRCHHAISLYRPYHHILSPLSFRHTLSTHLLPHLTRTASFVLLPSPHYVQQVIQAVLKWGSSKPKPPLERLEQLVRLIADKQRSNQQQRQQEDMDVVDVDVDVGVDGYYDEFVSIWRALCTAHKDGR